VLEIKEKEPHIQNLHFVVNPLPERELPIRIAWPDGRPADGSFFCITYEYGGEWEHLHALSQCGGDESNGMAEVPVFGDAPIRLYAYAHPDKNEKLPHRYSKVVELDPSALPHSLDLPLISTDPPK
jgi:hypothetical protein